MQNILKVSLIILLIVVCFSAVADARLSDGLIGYWPFDEGSGETVADASGNGNDLTKQDNGGSGWASTTEARIGNSAFHAGGDRVHFGTGSGDIVNGLSAFSLSIWVKSEWESTDRGFVLGKTGGSDYLFNFRYDDAGFRGGADNCMKAGITTTAGTHEIETSANSTSTDWQHLVFTWTAGEAMKVYIDGVLDTPSYTGTVRGGTITDVDNFSIGRGAKTTDSRGWRGFIDDVRLYNRPLTQTEITLLASGATRDPIPYEVALEGVSDLTADSNVGGTDVEYTVRVTNLGTNADTIILTTSGDLTANLSETELTLNSEASEDVTLTIPASGFTTPGRYEVNVTATSQGDTRQTATITTTTTVLPDYDVRLTGVGDLARETADGSLGMQYTINVTNIGTGTETILLTPSGDVALVTLSEYRITLEGGESERVTLTIPGSGLLTPGVYTVRVTAASPDDTDKRISITTRTTVLATVNQNPTATVAVNLSGGTLRGKGYAVVAHSGALADGKPTSALPVLPPGVPLSLVSNMPDLERFIQRGGTIDVFVADSTPPDVVITEIMWALDENAVGTAAATKHQWIELYNRSDESANLNRIALRFQPLLPVPSKGNLGSRRWTDRFSNVETITVSSGFVTGWRLGNNHGQNGNTRTANLKEFISMYRRTDRLGDNDGRNSGNWRESTAISHSNHKGTPGESNSRSAVSVTEASPGKFEPPKGKVIINEVYNAADDEDDWIELRALEDTDLHNWTLSYAKSNFSETEILRFPDIEVEAGEVYLFVNKEPYETNLASGQNLENGPDAQERGAGPHKYRVMTGSNKVEIPDYNKGIFYLILREREGWTRYESKWRMHDVVGPARFARRPTNAENIPRDPHTKEIWETDIWPLNGHRTNFPDEIYLQTSSQYRFSVGNVWERNGTNHGWKKDGGKHVGYKGGIGYGRGVDPNTAKGTPGYHNDIIRSRNEDLRGGQLVISELMLTTAGGRYSQWIEIHNTSKTDAIDLYEDTDGNARRQGWSIVVENHNSGFWEEQNRLLNVEVTFRDLGVQYIPPNQTILITASMERGVRNSGDFPAHRVAVIWGNAGKLFGMTKARDIFLNAEGGFLLQLVDGSGTVIDEVGNLDGIPANPRTDTGFDDPYSWHWPTDTVGSKRSSLIRIYDNGNPRPGTPDREVVGSMRGASAPLGTQVGENAEITYSWVHAADTKYVKTLYAKKRNFYYGSRSDYGTPGHTLGTPVPVSLSAFQPRLENGQVVIRWTTESELENAGFNILRSNTRNGVYQQVNQQLIQGAGTTGERSTYKWTDTTAKPGVLYYFQIEDVSFAGERQTLTTARLKGLISVKNKLTAIWGKLKKLD